MIAMIRGSQELSLGCGAVSQSNVPGRSAVAICGLAFFPITIFAQDSVSSLMFKLVSDIVALHSPVCPELP